MTKLSPKRRLAHSVSLSVGALMIFGVSLGGIAAASANPSDDAVLPLSSSPSPDPSQTAEAPTTFSIIGAVRSTTGGDLAGVTVSVRIPNPGFSDTVISTTTSESGGFTLEGVKNGTFTVSFVLAGYGDTTRIVTVAGANPSLGSSVTMQPLIDTSDVTVTISGTGAVGSPLTVSTTGWPDGTVLTYDWFSFQESNGGSIDGATGDTYVVTKAVLGRTVSVHVYGQLAGFAPDYVRASNSVTPFATQKPTGPAPADTSGSIPTGQTSVGLPSTPLDPGTSYTANMEWLGADSFVDVYIFSTPTLVGTFPVVNGIAQIKLSAEVLAKLSAGTHTLVVTGQTSGAVQSVTISLGLAATGSDMPIAPVIAGSLLLLLGGALVIARRRAPQKA